MKIKKDSSLNDNSLSHYFCVVNDVFLKRVMNLYEDCKRFPAAPGALCAMFMLQRYILLWHEIGSSLF
jgi:hypothetical protein